MDSPQYALDGHAGIVVALYEVLLFKVHPLSNVNGV
jgi:hypothetical protein